MGTEAVGFLVVWMAGWVNSRQLEVIDFFTVEVLAWTGLVRYVVLFVIDLQTRRVQIGGVVRQAYGAWMKHVAPNLTDGVDGFLIGKLRGLRGALHDLGHELGRNTIKRILAEHGLALKWCGRRTTAA